MLKDFLKVNLLGTIYTDEIFFFYEEPQIFTCINKAGHKYLSLLTDMDNREWLLVPISEAQLSLLKCNRISLKEAFRSPEDDYVWKIYSNDNTLANAEQIKPQDISNDDLPEDGLFLDWNQDCMMPNLDDDIVNSSKKEKRDILDISLQIEGNHFREISCELLGEVLTDTQQLIYALAYKNDNIKGKIPKAIRAENTLQVTGTFAASFGVRFKSYDISNMLDETLVSPVLYNLSKLLQTKNNQEKLKSFLSTQSKRAVIKYRNLMNTLIQANAGLKVKCASPNENHFNVDFTQNDILENLAILEGEIKNMVSKEVLYGEIVGINVDRKTFAFRSIDGEHITGKLSHNFVDAIFEVPQNVEIEVEQQFNINDLTKEEKYTYTLLKINNIVPKL